MTDRERAITRLRDAQVRLSEGRGYIATSALGIATSALGYQTMMQERVRRDEQLVLSRLDELWGVQERVRMLNEMR